MRLVLEKVAKGRVYCPICTHTVDADVDLSGRRAKVIAGQKCPRCRTTLDAGVVMQLPEAA
jgi:transposase-like protein